MAITDTHRSTISDEATRVVLALLQGEPDVWFAKSDIMGVLRRAMGRKMVYVSVLKVMGGLQERGVVEKQTARIGKMGRTRRYRAMRQTMEVTV